MQHLELGNYGENEREKMGVKKQIKYNKVRSAS